MKKIKPGIRLGELDTFSDLIIRLYQDDKKLSTDHNLDVIMQEMISLSAKLTTAIKSDRIVSNFNKADEKRNTIISNLKQLVKGYAVIPIDDKREYAQKILDIINKYKGITKKSSREKSSYIESMLEELLEIVPLDQTNILEGVSYQLVLLRSTQDDYNKLNVAYLTATANKLESASQVKKILLTQINSDFIPYMNTLLKINNALCKDFVAKLDIEIDKLNSLIVSRTKNKAVEEETKNEEIV